MLPQEYHRGIVQNPYFLSFHSQTRTYPPHSSKQYQKRGFSQTFQTLFPLSTLSFLIDFTAYCSNFISDTLVSGLVMDSLQSVAFVLYLESRSFNRRPPPSVGVAKAVSVLHWTPHRRLHLPAAVEIIRGFWSRGDRIKLRARSQMNAEL